MPSPPRPCTDPQILDLVALYGRRQVRVQVDEELMDHRCRAGRERQRGVWAETCWSEAADRAEKSSRNLDDIRPETSRPIRIQLSTILPPSDTGPFPACRFDTPGDQNGTLPLEYRAHQDFQEEEPPEASPGTDCTLFSFHGGSVRSARKICCLAPADLSTRPCEW